MTSATRLTAAAPGSQTEGGDLDPGVNRAIYNERYTPEQLEARPDNPFDQGLVELRHELIKRYGHGREVLDVGCGSGTYLRPHLADVRSAVGLDFSRTMLDGFRERLANPAPDNLRLVEGDARSIPLSDASVDLAFSFASLYYVPQVHLAIAEMARVLRPAGTAIFELGALWSLNTLICREQHRELGWARVYHIPYRAMKRNIRDAQLEVEEWRSFQVVPLYGVSRRLRPLLPLLHPRWKALAGRASRGRMLSEHVASVPFLRPVAFRHIVVARKP